MVAACNRAVLDPNIEVLEADATCVSRAKRGWHTAGATRPTHPSAASSDVSNLQNTIRKPWGCSPVRCRPCAGCVSAGSPTTCRPPGRAAAARSPAKAARAAGCLQPGRLSGCCGPGPASWVTDTPARCCAAPKARSLACAPRATATPGRLQCKAADSFRQAHAAGPAPQAHGLVCRIDYRCVA